MGANAVTSIELVREFHRVFGIEDAAEPHTKDAKLNDLRVRLLQEELNELRVALNDRDQVAVLDALADLQYVLDGSFLQLGFAHVKDAAVAEVHRSNMTKLDNGVPLKREDGKIVKGRNYEPPDLESLLKPRAALHCDPPVGFVPWPDDKPARYNACTDPCDMWDGPCACGAWHKDGR